MASQEQNKRFAGGCGLRADLKTNCAVARAVLRPPKGVEVDAQPIPTVLDQGLPILCLLARVLRRRSAKILAAKRVLNDKSQKKRKKEIAHLELVYGRRVGFI